MTATLTAKNVDTIRRAAIDAKMAHPTAGEKAITESLQAAWFDSGLSDEMVAAATDIVASVFHA